MIREFFRFIGDVIHALRSRILQFPAVNGLLFIEFIGFGRLVKIYFFHLFSWLSRRCLNIDFLVNYPLNVDWFWFGIFGFFWAIFWAKC